MKFDFLFLLFVFVIVSTSMASAVGFSPSSLTFSLEQNQEECKMITIDSESETITASDSWAENESVEWKVSSFDPEASQHEISINYDNELSIDEREVEVCLSGNKIGEYHGVLLFEEEQQGNSIIKFGVWLKVLINEKPVVSSGGSSGGGSGGGAGGGSGGGGIVATKNSTNATNSSGIGFENLGLNAEARTEGETQEDYVSGITGGAIWGDINAKKLIVPGLVILAIVAFVIYNKRKKLT